MADTFIMYHVDHTTLSMLSPEAIRVMGVLLEKEQTVPDSYPLTLNSLVLGCNQSTNREPVVSYDEMTVERALTQLRESSLALRGVYTGSRVPKHRHQIDEMFHLTPGAKAVLTVLLLRGDQTLGELKQRTERMCGFSSLDEVEKAVDELVHYDIPLAHKLERLPGQKEGRIQHLIGTQYENIDTYDALTRPSLHLIDGEGADSEYSEDIYEDDLYTRVDKLEKEVTVLTHEIMSLRAEIDSLRDPSA